MKEKFDLIIIGGGPAGYIGAIRAAQLNMKVAVIEKSPTLGGTCLNVGCIPSKAMLNMSEKFEEASKHYVEMGINIGNVSLDLKKMISKKDKTVSELTRGIQGLFVKNKITTFNATAKFVADKTIEINTSEGPGQLTADKFLIATGSDAAIIPGMEFDGKRIISSTEALNLQEVPKNLTVIGGGYIGLELGSVWRRLGAKVNVIELSDRLVPAMDKEISRGLEKILSNQGMEFHLSTKVLKVTNNGGDVSIETQSISDSKTATFKSDYVLVAVGRTPHTKTLNLNATDVKIDDKGRIITDKHYMTSAQNIYAVGDVIAGPMLAHKAEEEAVAAVEIMAGFAGHVNYNIIPGVIYTDPEVASVGKTEEELKAANIEYKMGKFPFLANSRAKATGVNAGFVKILADKTTDRILGAHIIGPDAGTMIAEIVVAMEFHASSDDLARICHAHPTLNEAIKEAALAVAGRTLNI